MVKLSHLQILFFIFAFGPCVLAPDVFRQSEARPRIKRRADSDVPLVVLNLIMNNVKVADLVPEVQYYIIKAFASATGLAEEFIQIVSTSQSGSNVRLTINIIAVSSEEATNALRLILAHLSEAELVLHELSGLSVDSFSVSSFRVVDSAGVEVPFQPDSTPAPPLDCDSSCATCIDPTPSGYAPTKLRYSQDTLPVEDVWPEAGGPLWACFGGMTATPCWGRCILCPEGSYAFQGQDSDSNQCVGLWSLGSLLALILGSTLLLCILLVLAHICFNGLDLAIVYSKRRNRLRVVTWQPRKAYDPVKDLSGLPAAPPPAKF